MAKRKRAQATSKQSNVVHAKWAEEETVTLIAWLDFTIKNPKLDFRSSIQARLGNLRSLNAIESKLGALWKAHGPYPLCRGLTGKKDLYERGSIALDNPGHGINQAFKDRLAMAKEKFAIEFKIISNVGQSTAEERKVPLRGRNTTPKETKYAVKSDSATPTPRKAASKRLRVHNTWEVWMITYPVQVYGKAFC